MAPRIVRWSQWLVSVLAMGGHLATDQRIHGAVGRRRTRERITRIHYLPTRYRAGALLPSRHRRGDQGRRQPSLYRSGCKGRSVDGITVVGVS